MTKKVRVLVFCLVLGVQFTTFGWLHPETERSVQASAFEWDSPAGVVVTTRSTQRRRGSSNTRLARTLQKQVEEAIAQDQLRGEDPEVRQVVLKALGSHAGSVVIMDPHTGRIFSIVNQEWAARKSFIPCSTIKPYTALAGLKEGVIQLTFQLPGGQNALALSLIDALSHSDNPYFQQIGLDLGLEKIRRYAWQFGLGQRTGINLRGEVPGRIPTAQDAEKSGLKYSTSHGKGFEVTPLQLAVFTSALANRGFFYQPQIVTRETEVPSEGYGEGGHEPGVDWSATTSFTPILRRQIDISEAERLNITAGMKGAVEFGTARKTYDPTLRVAGKTGTCTGDNGLRVGLFASFANIERPTLVVVVVTVGSGESGASASEIAGEIYQQLADRFNLRSSQAPSSVTGSQ